MLPDSSARQLPGTDELLSVVALPITGRGTAIVKVVGEVDHFTAPLLASCLFTQTNRRGLRELVVDMEEVSFLGSAGLSALAGARQQCHAMRARLVVRCGARRAVLRPLELAGLSWLAQRPRRRLHMVPTPSS